MFTRAGHHRLLCRDTVCGGGVRERTLPLAQLLDSFQSLPLLPTSKVGPSGADSQVGGLVHILGPCGSLQWTLLEDWKFLPLPPQPPQGFSVRGFDALFPHAGTLGCMVCLCLAPQLFLPVYLHSSAGPPCLPVTTLQQVLSALLPVSAPPTVLDECFFFNSLVVRLPCSLIFCQFWLFFVFKFVVVLLLVVWGGPVCLPMPPSWLDVGTSLFRLSSLPTCLDVTSSVSPWL